MSRRRAFAILLSLTLISVAVAPRPVWRLAGGSILDAAQSMGSAVTPARAAPFVGDWSAPVTSPMGPTTYIVSVKIDNGKVVATVNGGMGPPAVVSDISLVGQNLFLKYVNELPGMSIPGLIAMTPQGSNMLLTISIMDGQFEMAGTATKGGAAGRGAAGRAAVRRRGLRAVAAGPRRSRRSLASPTSCR